MNIITENMRPPIPVRYYDWCAYFDGMEDGPYGWGPTREAAMQEIMAGT